MYVYIIISFSNLRVCRYKRTYMCIFLKHIYVNYIYMYIFKNSNLRVCRQSPTHCQYRWQWDEDEWERAGHAHVWCRAKSALHKAAARKLRRAKLWHISTGTCSYVLPPWGGLRDPPSTDPWGLRDRWTVMGGSRRVQNGGVPYPKIHERQLLYPLRTPPGAGYFRGSYPPWTPAASFAWFCILILLLYLSLQLLRRHDGIALFRSIGNSFVEGKIGGHPLKMTQKRPKLGGRVILWYKWIPLRAAIVSLWM